MAGEWDGGGGSLGLLGRATGAESAHMAAGKNRTRKGRLEAKKRPLVSTGHSLSAVSWQSYYTVCDAFCLCSACNTLSELDFRECHFTVPLTRLSG